MRETKVWQENDDIFSKWTATIYSLGVLNWKIYDNITINHTTDEVIITEEQLLHIRERHPEAYTDVKRYVKDILDDPDYIIKDHHPNTGLVVKKLVAERENVILVLKIATSDDRRGYKNSIITSWKITEKRLDNYLRNKDVVYKKK